MSKKVLLATEKPFSPSARDQVLGILKGAGYESLVLESYKGKEPLLKAVADVDALIVRSDIVDADVLAAATKLKLVVRAGAGYDNIDCAKAKERGVAVMNTPGQNANAVAELAMAMMLFLAREKFNGKTGSELRGKHLGIHAMGATGRALARAAKGFGMHIRAFDPYVSAEEMRDQGAEPVTSLEELYAESDYISLHMPANKETKKSIGKNLLARLPKHGMLVNTARAELIHEEELLQVLEERKDLRYATDIAPSEPTQATIKEKFIDRVYWTPKKMGAQTEEANVNAGLAAARQIVGFLERNERKYVVNG
ncbi:MAG TPA: NAD(P)-dependent oxidoreductase [Polyangia bacterium]|jgi:D-3-phosphoglycerate dehydrogenase